MKKKLVLVMGVFIVSLILVSCGNDDVKTPVEPKKATKEQKKEENKKEEKTDYIKIANNDNTPLESKKVIVKIPKMFSDPRTTEDDKKLVQDGINEYNNTTQKIYKNSITILSYDSYYDEKSNQLVVLAILINNRAKAISNVEFKGDMQITIDPKSKVIPGEFELKPKFYDPIAPGEGTIVPLFFRVLNYTKDIITFNKKEIVGNIYDFKFKEINERKDESK